MTNPANTDPASNVHPCNREHATVLPIAFLETLGALPWTPLSAANKTALFAKWQAGPAPSALERLNAENEARALHRLAHGGDVEIDGDGRLAPPMTASDRMRLHEAEHGPAKRPAPPVGLTRDELPMQFRNLQGRALLDVGDRVVAADAAKAKLANDSFLSTMERKRLSDIVVMGGGGRVLS